MEKNNTKQIVRRVLAMKLPKGQSCFLWGARKTGKSFYLAQHYPDSVYFDLLKTDVYIRLLKEPYLLRREIQALDDSKLEKPIIIDEVQKVPLLLDEVHYLIENTSAYFILCGSSARKLKREGANLLGGRAWRYEFYPFVYPEIPDFNLLHALQHGLIPSHYLAQNWRKTIKAYVNDYLTEEIKAEGLTRNLRAFAEFLDISALSSGEVINYTNIARDCGIDSKTVKEYYQILVDTLIGYFIKPYKNKKKRDDIVASPKFYFFDVGVVNYLSKRNIEEFKGDQAGKAFENYILMELMAYAGLNDLDFDISYWRTRSGTEVDFILGDAKVAIEVKISDRVRQADLKGLTEFSECYKPEKTILVNLVPNPQRIKIDAGCEIDVLPWRQFLEMLWSGQIIQ